VLTEAEKKLVRTYAAAGQDHVFRFVEELDGHGRQRLFEQAASIDLDEVATLVVAEPESDRRRQVGPPGTELVRIENTVDHRRLRRSARERGLAEMEAGRVAVVVAAGGQGTRLGSPAPKAMWPVGPASSKSLLQWHAEKVLYWARKFDRPIPFVIMVSEATRHATERFLRWHGHFGLDPTSVKLACQASLPPVDAHGKLLLAAKDQIATAPNGHGGTYRALGDAKLLDLFEDCGIRTLSYIQVDNPLIRPLDPVFIGFHLRRESLLSSKAVRKRDPSEKVGVFATIDGRSGILEYSELTEGQSKKANPDGQLTYGQANIAAHVIDVGFARRMADRGLPHHRARKKVPHLDQAGALVLPTEPNATKFETFLFDAIPLAERSLVLETRREEEFSPIKNAEGEDSPATARRDLVASFRRWMEGAHVTVPEGALEIAPTEAPEEYEYRVGRDLSGDR